VAGGIRSVYLFSLQIKDCNVIMSKVAYPYKKTLKPATEENVMPLYLGPLISLLPRAM
jgi:hypothetical protein